MPFKPNYNQQRRERDRIKEQRKQEKLQRRQEESAKRKAERTPGGGEPETSSEPSQG